MYSHLDNLQEHQNKATINDAPIKQGEHTEADFVDNSPQAKEAAQLQAMADSSPDAEEGAQLQAIANSSPDAKEAVQLQAMANNSPDAKEVTQLQNIADEHGAQEEQPKQKKVNNTGLPDDLKTGIENLSGFSMDDVKVHYNSSKPAELQAHAYAEGTDIYIGPGQEKHLPHEAWHVVQQKQGRVKPTLQMEGGVDVNDDKGLEKEADVMGGKALQFLMKDKDSINQEEKTFTSPVQKKTKSVLQRFYVECTKDEAKEEDYIELSSEEKVFYRNLPNKHFHKKKYIKSEIKTGWKLYTLFKETKNYKLEKILDKKNTTDFNIDDFNTSFSTNEAMYLVEEFGEDQFLKEIENIPRLEKKHELLKLEKKINFNAPKTPELIDSLNKDELIKLFNFFEQDFISQILSYKKLCNHTRIGKLVSLIPDKDYFLKNITGKVLKFFLEDLTTNQLEVAIKIKTPKKTLDNLLGTYKIDLLGSIYIQSEEKIKEIINSFNTLFNASKGQHYYLKSIGINNLAFFKNLDDSILNDIFAALKRSPKERSTAVESGLNYISNIPIEKLTEILQKPRAVKNLNVQIKSIKNVKNERQDLGKFIDKDILESVDDNTLLKLKYSMTTEETRKFIDEFKSQISDFNLLVEKIKPSILKKLSPKKSKNLILKIGIFNLEELTLKLPISTLEKIEKHKITIEDIQDLKQNLTYAQIANLIEEDIDKTLLHKNKYGSKVLMYYSLTFLNAYDGITKDTKDHVVKVVINKNKVTGGHDYDTFKDHSKIISSTNLDKLKGNVNEVKYYIEGYSSKEKLSKTLVKNLKKDWSFWKKECEDAIKKLMNKGEFPTSPGTKWKGKSSSGKEFHGYYGGKKSGEIDTFWPVIKKVK